MPEPRKPVAPKGKGINRRVGGFPVWVWGVGILTAVAVGLWLRNRSHTAAQSGTATAPAQDTSTGTADMGAGSTSGSTTGSADLGDLGLQNNIDAAKAQLQDFSDWITQTQSSLGASPGFDTGGGLGSIQPSGGPSSSPRMTGAWNFATPPANLSKKQVSVLARFRHAHVRSSPNNSAGRSLGVAALRSGQIHVVTPTAVQHPAVTNTLRARFGAVPTTASGTGKRAPQ